ncbi:MGMT family protein [Serinicoccus sp. LYQ131]|uniref:MGMT family protein n=1 Tax=Serinicoccus sp. LYQ131 TaxID=3378797 RepID=UPI003852B8B8
MDEVVVEKVLRAIEEVPPGRVVSYGDLGALVGINPRHVGLVLRHWGDNVTWWRVTNRDGELPPELLARARPRWQREGIPEKPDGRGCRIDTHRVDLELLRRAYSRATDDLDDAAG